MRYDLATMAMRMGLKRRETTFSPIIITSALKSDLAKIDLKMLAYLLRSKDEITRAYAREYKRQLQTDAVDDLTPLFDELGAQLERLIIDLTPALLDFGLRVERWHRSAWASNLLAGTDVNISALIGPDDAAETIELFMARNTALIRKVNDETRGKIADLVYRGLQQRTSPREVGRAIAASVGISRKRANRIAADQATKLASALDRQRQREAGLDHWKWRHSGKVHFRPEHKARDGKIYTDETAPEDEPGELPYCGCVRQGVLILPE